MSPASTSKQAILPFSDNTINALAGGIAGGLTAVFVCPLDVLKTRLQLQRTSHLQKGGIAGGLTSIVKQEGIKGLYRGLGPTLLALLPNWAVYFTVYDKLKHSLVQRPGGERHLILSRAVDQFLFFLRCRREGDTFSPHVCSCLCWSRHLAGD